MNQYLLYYLILINAITYIVFAVDKSLARNHAWRVPEKTLFSLCILGGSFGGYLSMYTFRHKTKHKSFTVGVPLIMISEGLLIWLLTSKGII